MIYIKIELYIFCHIIITGIQIMRVADHYL